jgi:hypothetical protein
MVASACAMAWPGAAHAATWDASAIASHAMLYLDSPPGFREAMFREAAATGATSIRVDVPVPAIVRGPSGERSWAEIEDVERLARKYDLDVVGLLYGTPWWMAQCPRHSAPGVKFYMCPPRNPRAFARLAGEIARHTRGTIDTWQVLNEPNNRYVFAGDVRQYARILIATSRAIRRANPRARIVLGGLGGPKMQVWPARLLAIPGSRGAFDIASVHLRGRLKVVVSAVAFWRRRLAELGFRGPIWATEHGYPTDPAFQWDKRFQGVAGQARYLSRSLPALIGAGIDRIFITLRDNRGGPWATEGLIGGTVFDPPSPAPQVVRKPAAEAVRRFAMSLLTRVRAVPAIAAPPSLAQAPAARLRAARGCYSPGGVMALSGAGFAPSEDVRLTFVVAGARGTRTLAAREAVGARADGTLSASYRVPALVSAADRRERLVVLAGSAPGVAPFAVAAPRLTLRLSARPCTR